MNSSAHDVIAAVSGPNPYEIYRECERLGAFWRDPDHQMWVAITEQAAQAVLTSPALGVRPLAAPVPDAMAGTELGEVFGRLVRMTDGKDQIRAKRALSLALDGVDLDAVKTLARRFTLERTVDSIHETAFWVPAGVIATMLGCDPEDIDEVVSIAHLIARAFGPGATEDVIAAAIPGVNRLLAMLSVTTSQGLLHDMITGFENEGLERSHAVANGIGLLFQAHDATAGLITAAIERRRQPEASRAPLADCVRRAATDDPAIHNTRRFAHQTTSICGHSVKAGDSILVVLGNAAELAFGTGAHACPGREIAFAIAEGVVGALEAAGKIPDHLPKRWLPLPNARIADFRKEETTRDSGDF